MSMAVRGCQATLLSVVTRMVCAMTDGSDEPDPERTPTTPAKDRAVRLGRERVRAELGLAVWEVELAVETGILSRGTDRRFDPSEIRAALEDMDTFRNRLEGERRLNATEAAERLKISKQRFARVVEQAGVSPVAEEDVRKYGRVLTIRYYRSADIDQLIPYAGADQALREAVTTVGRSDAAKKGARTRAENKQRATQARLEVEAAGKAAQTSSVNALRYAAALACGAPDAPGFLRKFMGDKAVRALTVMIASCRLTKDEHRALLTGALELSGESHIFMAGPDEIRRLLGVDPCDLAGRVEMIGGFADRRDLTSWASAPPAWLLAAHAAEAAADAETAALRAQFSEQRKVLDSAEQALRLTDESVAEIFGLPVDLVAALRPRKRRSAWHPEYVARLRANPPDWLSSEAAARQEIARRRARRTR